MEERQIQEFVHQAVMDQAVISELMLDPLGVIKRGGYSSRVESILLRLVPCLTFEEQVSMGEKWWHA
jgi:hypothetical protein